MQGHAGEGLTPLFWVGMRTLARPPFRTVTVTVGELTCVLLERERACHQVLFVQRGRSDLPYCVVFFFSSTITRMRGIMDSIIIQLDPKSE